MAVDNNNSVCLRLIANIAFFSPFFPDEIFYRVCGRKELWFRTCGCTSEKRPEI